MSSDLFDGEDYKGTSVGLEMNVHNTLFMHSCAKDDRDHDDLGPDMVTVTFPGNANGLELARKLRDALDGWIEHVEGDSGNG